MFARIPLPFTIYLPFLDIEIQDLSTFGLFVALGFVLGALEFRRTILHRKMDPIIADRVASLSVLSGLLGGRIFFLFEARSLIHSREDFFAVLTGPGGFVFHGGFLLAALMISLYSSWKRIPPLHMADLIAPSIALGYATGRIGCFLSGDGCFGTGSPFSFFPLTVTPGPFSLMSTGGVAVWNTPLMESVVAFFLFRYLKRKSENSTSDKNRKRNGRIFAFLLVGYGALRFPVEFLRHNDALIPLFSHPALVRSGRKLLLDPLNPGRDGMVSLADFYRNWHWYGPTEAQLVALVFFLVGVTLLWISTENPRKR